MTAESAAESPNVVIGTSMVNSYPATVLFDTGATHSFISQSFVEHHGIRTSTMKRCMLVSSPGAQLRSHMFWPQSQCFHRGRKVQCKSDGDRHQGIDVILGMDTLAKWGVRIDYAQRTVQLSEEGRGVDEDLS